MKKYNGREWNWWISLNSHECRFCHNEYLETASFQKGSQRFNDMHLGSKVVREYNLNMCKSGYWKRLHQVWLAHMKKYHPEILEGSIKEQV